MEEQINKKNIIIVFSALLLLFLFFYKGFILSGEDYTEEYNSFVANLDSTKKSAMKKGNVNSNSGSSSLVNSGSQPGSYLAKKEIKIEQKSLYEVMEALENIKLNLGAMKHNIKSKLNNLIKNVNEDFESEENFNKNETISINATVFKKYSNLVEELNKESENDIEKMWEGLEKEIETLRSISNNNSISG
jgi:hypothetical protein